MPLTPPSLTLGLEEEYLLVDPTSRDLVAAPPEGFMQRCEERLGGRVAHELLQAQVEVGTSVCQDVGAARAQLMELRATVAATAREFGMAMIAASTHPFASWRAQKKVEKERYLVLARDMQTLASRLVICGMHVHAGIEDDELRIDLMNQAAYFLPHLLALSTSSPFWQGQPTGLKAYRPTVFGDLPRSGLPEYFASAEEWRHMLHLLSRPACATTPPRSGGTSARAPGSRPSSCASATSAPAWRTRSPSPRCGSRSSPCSIACARATRPGGATGAPWSRRTSGSPSATASAPSSPTSAVLARKPFGVLLEEIIELVRDEAMRLGCLPEVLRAREILDRGTSADRQLNVYARARAAGAGEREAAQAVVDWLIEETMVGIAPDAALAAA